MSHENPMDPREEYLRNVTRRQFFGRTASSLSAGLGMAGLSFPGISQLFVAQTQPPGLSAITPLSVIAETSSSTLYPGGIANNGFAFQWATNVLNGAQPYGQGWEQGQVDAEYEEEEE